MRKSKKSNKVKVSRGCGFEQEITFTIAELEAQQKAKDAKREEDGDILWA